MNLIRLLANNISHLLVNNINHCCVIFCCSSSLLNKKYLKFTLRESSISVFSLNIDKPSVNLR